MRQHTSWLARWVPLTLLMGTGALIFRIWLSTDMLPEWLNQWALCG